MIPELPTITHPTDRPNYTEVTLYGPQGAMITLAYSYATCVAFQAYGVPDLRGPRVRGNEWGPTTGKHMAQFAPAVPKSERIGGAEFAELVSRALAAVLAPAEVTA
jgi:hypothetical protein